MISIIIVNYNGGKLILDCIKSIYSQTYKDFEIIVSDNNSSDNSVKNIKKQYPNVIIIENKKNLGFAEGNNVGIRNAKGEFVLFTNPDTVLSNHLLERILVPMKDKKVGMVAPEIWLPNMDIDSYGLVLPASGLGRDIKLKEDVKKIIAPCGACALYRKSTLDDIKIGDEYFDSSFFAYCEDMDLGIRAILRGWKIKTFSVPLIHCHSAFMSSAANYIQLLGHRNNILVVLKNYPLKTLIKNLHKILFWQIASVGIWFLRRKPFLILKLKWDAIKMIPQILKKRKIIQKRIKIKNFEEYLS